MNRKPHFRYYGRVWSCASVADWGLVIGYGYSVKEAWKDWKCWLNAWTTEETK